MVRLHGLVLQGDAKQGAEEDEISGPEGYGNVEEDFGKFVFLIHRIPLFCQFAKFSEF